MCGINVVVEGTEAQVRMMNTNSMHRGTRAKVADISSNTWLGQVRLPIQGLSKDYDPPVLSSYYSMVGVGEFFNYNKERWGNDFHWFMNEYLTRGDKAFTDVDGFWGLAIFNHANNYLNVYTDHLAKKPLYYRLLHPGIAISSEIRPLKIFGPCKPDEIYFSSVAKWGYCIENRTPYEGIWKIPPAHKLVYDTKKHSWYMHSYLDLKPEPHSNIQENIAQAVRNRLISDVPISIICSGGLDSTIILKIAQAQQKDYKVFFIGKKGDKDYKYFSRLVDEGHIPEDKYKILNPSDYDDPWASRIFEDNETPVDLGSVVPQWHLARAIKGEGYKVALSGDGADELFGGYGRARSYDSQMSDIFHELVYYHLPRLDKLMMAHTIELRCPFLSPPVIRGAMGIPYQIRTSKQHLKNIFADIVPEYILRRKKEPLKTRAIVNDPLGNRLKVIRLFRETMFGNQDNSNYGYGE